MRVHFKRLISVVLSVALVVSMMVVPASAADYKYNYQPDVSLWRQMVDGAVDAISAFIGVPFDSSDLPDFTFKQIGLVPEKQVEENCGYFNSVYGSFLREGGLIGATLSLIFGGTCVPGYDEENRIVRPMIRETGQWVVDKDGNFPYYGGEGDVPAGNASPSDPFANGWWLPDQLSESVTVLSYDSLSDLCVVLNENGYPCRMVRTLRFGVYYWVIQDYSTDAGANRIYGNSSAMAYVSNGEASVTTNQFDYIVGDNAVINDSMIIDNENGTLTLIDESGTKFELAIDSLTFDTGDKSYTVNAYNTINEGDNYYYTYYTYNITYNITNTYITYIGSNDAYDREEYEYYYQLPDGRSSADLTADEVAGMSFEFHDVVNYARSATDVSVRALYHFDGNTDDSSYFSTQGKFEWMEGASITYMEAPAAFDGALYLDNTAHSFDITLPSSMGTADYTIQFRYYQASEPDTQDNIDNYIEIGSTKVLCWDEKTVSRDPNGEYATWSLPIGTWNEIALVRHDGNLYVYLNGLCVSQESLYIVNWSDTITFNFGSGSRAYSMIDELRILNFALTSSTSPESRLPDGYTEVEYIESSGTQYIDTGVIGSSDIGFNITFNTSSQVTTSDYGVIFGALDENITNMFLLGLYPSTTGGEFVDGGLVACNPNIISNEWVDFSFQGNVLTTPSGNVTTSTAIFDTGVNIYLFCKNHKGATEYSKTKLSDFRLYNISTGNVLRDYVPCINPNDEVGLYDLVTGTFYGNSGTGTFSAGPVVSSVVTSVGTSYTPSAVPHDSNLVLVLPDSDRPIADEYWKISSSNENLLGNAFDFLDGGDESKFSLLSTGTNTLTNVSVGSYPQFGYSSAFNTFSTTSGSVALGDAGSNFVWYYKHGFTMNLSSVPSVSAGKPYTFSIVHEGGEVDSVTWNLDTLYNGSQWYENSSYTSIVATKSFDWGTLEIREIPTGTYNSSRDRYYYTTCLCIIPTSTIRVAYIALEQTDNSDLSCSLETAVYPGDMIQPNTAAVQSEIPVKGYTVGGVRPTLPAKGDCWFPVFEGRIQTCYIYTGYMWEEVGCRWYTGSRWIPIYAFDINTLQDLFDVADSSSAVPPLTSESSFWRWWQLQWLDFRASLDAKFNQLMDAISGGSSGSGSDVIVPDQDGNVSLGFSKFLDTVLSAVVDIASTVLQEFIGLIADLIQMFIQAVMDFIGGFVDVLSDAAGYITTLGDNVAPIGDFVSGIYAAIPDDIEAVLTGSFVVIVAVSVISFLL